MKTNEQVVFQGTNSAVDYTIATVASLAVSGPLGAVASFFTMKFLAKHAGAQQKWFVWTALGTVAAPTLMAVQVGILSAMAPEVVEDQPVIEQVDRN